MLGEAETAWGDWLPGDPGALFQWLLVQSQETLLDLLAYCTARSVNAVVDRPRNRNHRDALPEAREVVMEATESDATAAAAGMKKGDLVAYCAAKLEGTRWLPSPLRTVVSGNGREEDDAAD